MTIRELIRWDRPSTVSVRQGGFGTSLTSLQEEMNRLFEHFYTGAQLRMTDWDRPMASMPSVNITENGKAYTVKVELAGMNPEDVDIEVTDGYITLKGERKDEIKDESENYLRQEMSYGSFYRTLALPDAADCKKADASFKNGILMIEVPKKVGAVDVPKKLTIKKVA